MSDQPHSNTRVTILGHGPLAEPLAKLSERAGHSVIWAQESQRFDQQIPRSARNDGAPTSGSTDAADLVILAGSSTAVEPMLASIARSVRDDTIIVDASIPTQDERKGPTARSESGDWIAAAVPHGRVVRAFASLPADALAAVLEGPATDPSARVSIPLAGDDREAKATVATFMREIGVEPFDIGPLSTASALNPGGALWGKAYNQIEMLEAVGWLAGDG